MKNHIDFKHIRGGKQIIAILAMLLVVYSLFYSWGRFQFEVSFYHVKSMKVDEKIRVVELADLHNWSFGKNNSKLINRIEALKPDLIVMAGDMVNDYSKDISVTVNLCRELMGVAPVYYSFGNHENKLVFGSDITEAYLEEQAAVIGTSEDGTIDYDKFSMINSALPEALKAEGVILLNNTTTSVEVKNTPIDIAGVDNLSGTYFPYSSSMVDQFLSTNQDHFKLLVAHRPLVIQKGVSCQQHLSYDLALCGHTHGGIIRLPGLGGMLNDGAAWPWFSGDVSGLSETAQGMLLVSRGLGNSNLIPRIHNTPELVVVDISSY